MRARTRGLSSCPPSAELFLGFTSTVKQALGPPKIANFETLGYAKLRRPVLRGRHSHALVAHEREPQRLVPQLRSHENRWMRCSGPGFDVPARRPHGLPSRPSKAETAAEVREGFTSATAALATQARSRRRHVLSGTSPAPTAPSTARERPCHNARTSIRSTTPSPENAARGHEIARKRPQQGPISSSSIPRPTTFGAFASRWTESCPTGVKLQFSAAGTIGQGINPVFHATHRQNFLVPPRAHRSFPLAELPR